MVSALEGVPDDAQLALAADQFGARLVRDVDAEARVCGNRSPDPDRLGLALGLAGSRVLVVDRRASGPLRRLVDEDSIDGGGALQAGSSVDDIARGHPLACFGLSVETHERFPGRDPDA